MRAVFALPLLMIAGGASAATPQSYSVLDRASAAACRTASGLRDAKVGPATRFSDAFLMDVRTVTGTWPQRHMKGAKATMLCLYNRRTKRAETQELVDTTPPTPSAPPTAPVPETTAFRDVWWQVAELEGRKPVGPRVLTLMLGSDGKVGGVSGCNNYSANYQLNGTALKVYAPMIGTRMSCPPPVMAQEARYRDILAGAVSATSGPAGSLIVTAADGRAIRFVAAVKALR